MHLAFLIALAAQILWTCSSYIDRHLVEKRFLSASTGALMLYTAGLAAVVVPVLAAFRPEALHIPASAAAVTVGSGIFTYFGLVIYLYAIKKDDAATVVPLFQMTPVLVLIMSAFIPSERLGVGQAVGAVVVVLGAMALSFDHHGRRRLKLGLLKLVLAASLLYAFSIVMFKLTAIETDYWASILWYYVGLALSGIFTFAFSRPFRQAFLDSMRRNSASTFGLMTFNETINLVAEFLYHFALVLAPLGLIAVTSGLRPLLMLVIGAILTRVFPNFISDRFAWRDLRHKALPIIAICAGAVLVTWQ
jgi:drug/metabolite transporter (DMT)-like permease